MKKFFSLFLAAVMMFSTLPAVSATNIVTQDSTEKATTQVVYNANAESVWQITVPATLRPGTEGTVLVSGQWPSNQTLKVTTKESIILTNSINSSDKKTLTVEFDDIILAGDDRGAVSTSERIYVSAVNDALFGIWQGRIVYNVEMTNVVAH